MVVRLNIKRMAQEEQDQRGSTGSSGVGGGNVAGVSKSSKKQKQKKIPQRGLGVAQLERIRIEELKKKDGAAAAAMAATAILSPHLSIPQGKSLTSLSFSPCSDHELNETFFLKCTFSRQSFC